MQVREILTNNRTLKGKIEDLKNRSRRSNLRVLDVPGEIPPSQLSQIFAVELPQALGLQGEYTVERAHRLGLARPTDSEWGRPSPRPAIPRYLNYAAKEAILRKYKGEQHPLILRGSRVYLFSDYSVEVTKRRRAFSQIWLSRK